MDHPFLIGSKVYLRPLESTDAPTLLPWVNDPEVTRTLKLYQPLNLSAEEEFIAQVNQNDKELILGIVVRETDKLVGDLGLTLIDYRCRRACFGLMIGDKSAWGKGYGSEATALILAHAFETLNLNRVWLNVYEYNHRAIHVYEKLGFRREGVLRQDHYREGRYWDTIAMAILRAEWLAGKSQG